MGTKIEWGEGMKLGSLFDGIGGFPWSGTFFGITPVWASEIEPLPIRVTQHHFPNMKHLGDITQINGAEIEPVDVITFGSPCTRLSVAGRHDGFDITFECQGTKDEPHKIYTNNIRATDKYQYTYKDSCPICGKELIETNESALFFHAIRIISEMREATNGNYPRFIVWENVPGAFSSNKGEDFRAVLEEISQTEIPMPPSGKWATAGMVRTERVDVAWRTLDAQYWGVPQRRRRIFLVADFGGQCAGEILFIEEGLRGHFAESREAREGIAGDVGTGSAVTMQMREGCAGGGKGPLISEDKSLTLGCNNDQTVFMSYWDGGQISDCLDCSMLAKGQMMPEKKRFPAVLEPQLYDMTHADEVMRPVEKGISPTLNSRMGTGGNQVPVLMDKKPQIVPYGICSYKNGPQGNGVNEDVSFTLNTTDRHAVAYGVDCRNLYENNELSATIQAKPNGGQSLNYINPVRQGYAVRRLTPTECLRLQGFPDWWLDIEGASDTAKYKAIGNSVSIPCLDYIFSGITAVLQSKEEAYARQ